MYLSQQGLIVIVLVGLVAGWLASHVVRGSGLGIIGDIAVGIIGAFIGDLLMPRLGIHLGSGIFREFLNATAGAILRLFVIRRVRGSRWR